MASIPQVSSGAFGRKPQSYDDLRRLAARYASDELTGLTLVNPSTQLAVTLAPDALAAATRPGTPAALLRAIPELPSLPAQARYVRIVADGRRRSDVRQLHVLAAAAEIAGRLVELMFVVRESFHGQCFLDRVIERDESERRRQDGGAAPDDAIPTEADAGATDSTAPASNPSSSLSGTAGRQLSVRDQAYLDKYHDAVAQLARDYYVDPTLVLGVGIESTFASGGTYLRTGDAFGMTGGSTKNMTTAASPTDNARKFFNNWGAQIYGTGSNADAFANALQGRDAAGARVAGWKIYNSKRPDGWRDMIRNGIGQMQRAVPAYLQNRGAQ